VYGDDLDHACGDGWFDGSPIFYTRGYLAALCWISTHPWVRAWTVDENGFDPTLYRQPEPITVSSAICPSVDPLGVESIDRQGNRIHFDTWYEWWANTVSLWLGLFPAGNERHPRRSTCCLAGRLSQRPA